MGKKAWKCKILAGILCASLVFQSVSVTSFAEESTQEVQTEEVVDNTATEEAETSGQQETEQAPVTVAETESQEKQTESVPETSSVAEESTVASEGSTEAADDEETEAETETETVTTEEETEENTVAELQEGEEARTFEDIQIEFFGYKAYVKSVKLKQQDGDWDCSIFLVQYQGDQDNGILPMNISCHSQDGYYVCSNVDVDLYKDVDKVAVRAIIRDSSGNEIYNITSDPIERTNLVTDLSFSVKNVTAGAKSLSFDLSYDGDMKIRENSSQYGNVYLYYGNGTDESNWKSVSQSVYFSDYRNPQSLTLTGITANENLHGKLVVKVGYPYFDKVANKYIYPYEQELNLEDFTTREDKEYKFAEVFPDEVFQQVIRKYLWDTTSETVMQSELDTIREIYAQRSSWNDPAIKDLTGLDLLTNLRWMNISNHEISDITGIDWSKLTAVTDVYLYGNDITAIPDFTKNLALDSVSLSYNMLPESETINVQEKMPAGFKGYCNVESQRLGGLCIVSEPTYYQYSGKSPVFIKLTGYKPGLGYTLKLYIDGNETSLTNDGDIYKNLDTGLVPGNHTIKAEQLAGTTVVSSAEKEFAIVKQDAFVEWKNYYKQTDNYLPTYIYSQYKEGVNVAKAELIDSDGKTVAEKSVVSNNTTTYDRRYSISGNLFSDLEKFSGWHIEFTPFRNLIATGTYDVKLIYDDGTSVIAKDAIGILPSSEVCITRYDLGYECDNTGEYLYLVMIGNNIDPSKLNYSFFKDNVELKADYISSKSIYNGVIAKLKKNNWSAGVSTGSSLKVNVTPKSGYDIDIIADNTVYIYEGVFYSAYNPITGKVEAGLSSSLGKGEVKAELKEAWEADAPAIASATAQMNDDGLILFEMKNPDGSLWKPARSQSYYLHCTYDGRLYTNSFWADTSTGTTSVNFWSGLSQMVKGTGAQCWFYYYEGAPFDKDAKYESTISGETLSAPLKPAKVNPYSADYNGTARTAIALNYDLSKLEIGSYTITLKKNGAELSKYGFSVVAGDKFILNSYNMYWDNDNTIRVYLNTPSAAKNDNNYKVTLTDPYGNVVSGLTTRLDTVYQTGLYLNVTGLNRLDAYRQYYVKISHNKLGEAVKADMTTPYFTDKGELRLISLNRGGYSTSNNRVIGFYMKNAKLPAQLMIYKAYNAEEVANVQITSVGSNNYYYFPKSLYDQLPDKDALYDLVLVDSGDWVSTVDNRNIGYIDQQSNTWGYSISSTTLYLDDDELSKAIITVTGNKAKPTFKSSDSNVVKVAASVNNANVAGLEAVGLGTAEISITADGRTEKVTIKVTKLSNLEGISFNREKISMAVGAKDVLLLNTIPLEAWKDTQVITVSSSDTSVISVEQQNGINGEAARVALTAVKEGTATITAVLKDKDNEYRATAEVTVESTISEEEKASEIAKIGTLYALTNNSASLKDVKLPEGWTWISGEEQLEADERIQLFAAKYTRADGKSFIARLSVAVAELTGIQAETEGTGFINPGKNITYTLSYSFEGYQEIPNEVLASLATIQWDLSKGTCVSADAVDQSTITLTAKQAGTQEITVTVKAGSATFTDKVTVTVAGKDSVNRIEITAQQAAERGIAYELTRDELTVNAKDFEAGKADSIILSAKTFVDQTETAAGVDWSTSDENVATVATANGITTLTIKAVGTAVITATAADDGKYSYSIKVSVKDYAPILDNTKITLNINLESVELPIYEQNGNHMTGIEVYEDGSKSSNYEVAVNGCTATLKLKADSALRSSKKSTKTSVTFKIATQKGAYEPEAEITLDVKKISVKATQKKKPNIFYTDSEAAFEISSTYKIEKVEETIAADAPGFHLKAFDSESGTLTFEARGITKDNYDAYKKQTVDLKVTLSEFAGSVTVPVTIQTENKKPNLVINNATVYNAAQTELTTAIVDKKTKEQYVLSGAVIESLDAKPDKNGNGVTKADISSDGHLKLTVKGTKSASYKVTLSSNAWTQSLILSGKVAAAKQPVLVLGTNNVTLNKAHTIQSNGRYIIPVSIKDSDLEVWDVVYSISGSKDGVPKLSNYLYVGFDSTKQQLEIGLNKGHEGLKTGKYKITIKAKAKGVGDAKSASFNLTITDKAASAKLSAKGSINLADRAGTSVIYTPKLSDVSATVEQVGLTGDNAVAFAATVTADGKIEVKAVPGFSLRTDVNYDLGMVLTLDNDSEVVTSAKIKPVSKLPKVKASVTKGTLYKASDRVISTELSFTQKADQSFAIDRVRIVEDKNSKYFKVTYSPDGKVRISLSDKASELKAGKYTVKYNVYFKDAATNGKPVSMKMTVTVK